ncbi:MAG: hypothetical protein GY861_10595, partial [bacterium]|nr:hypothetical protein [bacterium]
MINYKNILVIILILLLPASAIAAMRIYPIYDDTTYAFEQGNHPSAPKWNSTYEKVLYSGNARVMDTNTGSSDISDTVDATATGKYACWGVFVSHPLKGGQTITTTGDWQFFGSFGAACYKSGQNWGNCQHAANAAVYLWKESWPNSHYMYPQGAGTRDTEWVIRENSNTSAHRGGDEGETGWTDNVLTYGGSDGRTAGEDGMSSSLSVDRGDRLVVEVINYVSNHDAGGGYYFHFNNGENSYLNWANDLYFAPYVYELTDESGDEVTETLASVGGETVMLNLIGGMFRDEIASSSIAFSGGWDPILATADEVVLWQNSWIKFEVPDITGTVNVSVYVNAESTSTQGIPLRILPQISTTNVVGPYGQNHSTFTYEVYGYSFQPGSLIEFEHGGIVCTEYDYSQCPSTITCTVQITKDAGAGTKNVYVVNPDGGECPSDKQAIFTITKRPKIYDFNPKKIARNVPTSETAWSTITVSGSDFDTVNGVNFEFTNEDEVSYGGINVIGSTVTSTTKMDIYIRVTSTATQSNYWRLVLSYDDGGYTDSGVTVSPPIYLAVKAELILNSLSFNGASPSDNIGRNVSSQLLTILGSGFDTSGVDVTFDVPTNEITVNSVDIYSGRLDINLDIASDCTLGTRDIFIENIENQGYKVWYDSFTVNAAPTISTITVPVYKQLGEKAQITLTVEGTDFIEQGAVLDFGAGITENNISLINISTEGSTIIYPTIEVKNGCPTGWIPLKVINADLGESNEIANALKINKAPSFTSLSHTSVGQGVTDLTITVNGTDFAVGAQVDFGIGVSTKNANYAGLPTSFTVDIDVAELAITGLNDVTVINRDQGYDTKLQYFEVTNKPQIDYITPDIRAQGISGSTITVVGAGPYFQSGLDVWFSTDSSGYPVDVKIDTGTIANFSSSLFELQKVTIEADAIIGDRYLVIENPDGGFYVSTIKLLEIKAEPTLTASGITVVGAVPSNQLGRNVSNKTIKITGSNFETGIASDDILFDVSLDSITIEGVTWKTTGLLEVLVSVSLNCPVGDRTVTVINPESGGSATRSDAGYFTIGEIPVISTITSPMVKEYGQSADTDGNPDKKFKIKGSDFNADLELYFGDTEIVPINASLSAGSTNYECDLVIDSNFTPTGSALDVTVVNPDLGEFTLTGAITINKKPSVTSLSQTEMGQGTEGLEITVNGAELQMGVEVDFGLGVSTVSYNYAGISNSSFTVTIDIDESATSGRRNITVTNPDLGYVTKVNYIEIIHSPDVDSVSPTSRAQGITGSTITVLGDGPYFQSGLEVWFSTSSDPYPVDVKIDTGTIADFGASSFKLQDFEVASDAQLGDRWIVVKNPDGGMSVSLIEVLEIVAAPTLDASGITVVGADPTYQLGQNVSDKTIKIAGTGFENSIDEYGVTFDVSSDSITVNSVTWKSSSLLEVLIDVSSMCPLGDRTVNVVNPDSGGIASRSDAGYFVIGAMPVISTITSPVIKEYGQRADTDGYIEKKLKIQGSGFDTDLILYFGDTEISPINVSLSAGATNYECDVVVDANFSPTGSLLDVKVVNPDLGEHSVVNTITINKKPSFTSLSQTDLGQGKTGLDLVVFGAELQDGCEIDFGIGITTTSYDYTHVPDSFTVTVDISDSATSGRRDATIMNPDLGYATKTNYINIIHSPDIDSISPTVRACGVTGSTITVIGDGPYFQSGLEVWFSTSSDPYPVDVKIDTGTIASFTASSFELREVAVDVDAQIGNRWIVVENPDGGMSISNTSVLEIKAAPTLTASGITVVGSDPSNQLGQNVTDKTVKISGTGFETGITENYVSFDVSSDSITVQSVTWKSSSLLEVLVNVSSGCPEGDRMVYLENPDSGGTVSRSDAGYFVISAMPTISTITSPTIKEYGQRAETENYPDKKFIIKGTDQDLDMELYFGNNEMTPLSASLSPGATSYECDLAIDANFTPTGSLLDVSIVNPDQGEDTLSNAITINKKPTFTSLSITAAGQGLIGSTIIVTGSDIQDGCEVVFGVGVSTYNAYYHTSSSFTVQIDVSDTATVGKRNVTIRNPDLGYATRSSYFDVTNKPVVDSISPDTRARGVTGSTITVVGDGPYFKSGLEVWFSTSSTGYPADVKIDTGTIADFTISSFKLQDFDVASDAQLGDRYIVVYNPDGGLSVSITSVLEIVSEVTLSAGGITVVGSDPSYQLGQNVVDKTIKISGTDFETGISEDDVYFDVSVDSITVQSVTWKSSSLLEALVNVSSGCPVGDRTVYVENPESGSSASRGDAGYFTIGAMPVISTITSPVVKEYGQLADTDGYPDKKFKVKGTDLDLNMELYFGDTEITPIDAELSAGATNYECDLVIGSNFSPTGSSLDVKLVNPDQGEYILSSAITVNKKPTVTSLSQTNIGQGTQDLDITVNGTELQNGVTVDFGANITVAGYNYAGIPASFVVTIDVDDSALSGKRNITVMNPDLGYVTKVNYIDIIHSPDIDSVSPTTRAQGVVGSTITVIGDGPYFQSGLDVWFSTDSSGYPVDVKIDTGTIADFGASSFKLQDFEVASDAQLGNRWIVINNPDGGLSVSLTEVLEIVAAPTLAASGITVVGADPTYQLGQNVADKTIKIAGTGFENSVDEDSVSFDVSGDSITIQSVTWKSSTLVEVVLNVSTGCPVGDRTVYLENPTSGGTVSRGDAGYFVIGVMPVISTITSPVIKEYGQRADTDGYPTKKFKIKGTDFNSEMELYFGNTEITPINALLSAGSTNYECDIAIDANFSPTGSALDVKVINPDLGEYIISGAITVNKKPVFSSLSQTNIGQGKQDLDLIIYGSELQDGCEIDFGLGITVDSYDYTHVPDSFTVTVDITESATSGRRDATIRNPDLGYATKANYINIIHSPDIDSISPTVRACGVTGSTITVIGDGPYFQSGLDVWFSTSSDPYPVDIKIDTGTMANFTASSFDLREVEVASDAQIGDRWIVVENPDGGMSISNTSVLEIKAAPTLTTSGITVNGAVPSYQLGQNVTDKTIKISGTGFETGITEDYVWFDVSSDSITIQSVTWKSSTLLEAVVNVSSGCPIGDRTVYIENPESGGTVSRSDAGYFVIGAMPVISTITSPVVKEYGQRAETENYPDKKFIFKGSNFDADLELYFGGTEMTPLNSSLSAGATFYKCDLSIDANFTPTGSALDVKVINPDLGEYIVASGITINKKPVFTSLDVTSAGQGATGSTVIVTGSDIQPDCEIDFGVGISTYNAYYHTSSSFTVQIDVSDTAIIGKKNVTITNPDLGYATKSNYFEIKNKPEVDIISPDTRARGVAGSTITILGDGPYFQSGLEVWFSTSSTGYPADVKIDTGTIADFTISSFKLQDFDVAADAQLGERYILIRNPDSGEAVSIIGVLEIVSALTLDASGITVVGANPTYQLGQNVTDKTVKITGIGFESGVGESNVSFDVSADSITVNSVTWKSSTLIEVVVDVSSMCPVGDRTVYVENPESGSVASRNDANYFTIGAMPVISTITYPVIKEYGQKARTADDPDMRFKVKGVDFDSDMDVYFGDTEMTPINITLSAGSTNYECDFIVDENFSPTGSTLDVKIINPDLGEYILGSAITINPKPVFASLNPLSAGQGTEGLEITVSGSSLQTGAEVDFGVGVSTVSYNYAGIPNTFTVTVDIINTAQAGYRDVTLINPDLGYAVKSDYFEVTHKPDGDYVTPDERAQGVFGSTITIIGDGPYFQSGLEVWFSTDSSGYPVDVKIDTGTIANFTASLFELQEFDVESDAQLGDRWMVIKNPDEGISVSASAVLEIVVQPALTASGITVVGSNPSYQLGQNSLSKTISITGSNFETGIDDNDVYFDVSGDSITVQSVSWKSAGLIDVLVNVSSGCPVGDRTVYVSNPESGGTASRGDAGYFVIGAMPVISTITSPVIKEYGQRADTDGYPTKKFKIKGTDFNSEMELYFGNTEITPINASLSAGSTNYECDLQIDSNFSPTGSALNVRLVNPDQGEYTVPNALTINKKPVFTSMDVITAGRGTIGSTVIVMGSEIQDGCYADFGVGISTYNSYYHTTSSFTVQIDISDIAVVGKRDVTIYNPDLGYATKTNYFEVTSKPDVDSIIPTIRAQGVSGSTITVIGDGPYFKSGLEVWFSTSSEAYPVDVKIDTGTMANFTASSFDLREVDVAVDAQVGDRWIVTKNPDGGIAISVTSVLEIVAPPTLTASGITITGSNPTYQLGQNTVDKTVKVTGSGFENGISESNVSFDVSGDSITIQSVTWKSSSFLEIIVNVSSGCPVGDRTVYIENPDSGGTVSRGDAGYFVIGAMPVISAITSPVVKEYGQLAETENYPAKKFKIKGTNFDSSMDMYFGDTEMSPLNISLSAGSTNYECDLTIDSNFTPTGSLLDLKLINPDQGEYVLSNAVTINKKPAFTSLSITSAGQGAAGSTVIITGSDIQTGCEIDFGVGISTYNVYYHTTSSFTVQIDVSDTAIIGKKNVTITNPDLGYATKSDYFEITNKPEVDIISPDTRARGVTGSTITVIGDGAYFQSGLEIWFSTSSTGYPADVKIDTGTISDFGVSSFKLKDFDVAADAQLGDRYIVIKNPDGGEYVSITSVLTITTELTLTASGLTVVNANPSYQLGQNVEDKMLRITGSGFETGIGDNNVSFDVSADSITVNSVTWKSSTLIEVVVDVSSMCPIGDRTVSVENPESGSTASRSDANYFTIGVMPVVSTITSPAVKEYGQRADTDGYPAMKFKIQGTNLDDELDLYFGVTEITPINATLSAGATNFECDLVIDSNFSPTGSALDVRVVNPDLGEYTMTGVMTVNSRPTFTSLSQTAIGQGTEGLDVTLSGSDLQDGAVIDFGVGVTATNYNYAGIPNSFIVTIDVSDTAVSGKRDATVMNPDLGYATKSNYIDIIHSPDIDSISPTIRAQGVTGSTITVIGDGPYFQSGVEVWFSTSSDPYPVDVKIDTGTIANFTSSTFDLEGVEIASNAQLGDRWVVVFNPDGGMSVSLTSVLEIVEAPTLTANGIAVVGSNPSYQLGQNVTDKLIKVTGTGFENGIDTDDISFDVSGDSITVQSVSWKSSILLEILVNVSSGCPAGDRTLNIENPESGGTASRGDAGYFVIGAMPVISTITSPVIKEYGQDADTDGHSDKKFKIKGTGFDEYLELYFGGTEITPINASLSAGSTNYECDLQIDSNFSPTGSALDVRIVNLDQGEYTVPA